MKIEELVPSLELCKKIPAGEFEDSALCWVDAGYSCVLSYDVIPPKQHPFVELRRYTIQGDEIPAPTVTEILKVLWNDYQKPIVYFRNIWHVTIIDDYEDEITAIDNENAANAALKLWQKLKGVE